ncbi:MAG: sigma-70 family RNA polymerase sigma factor [Gammaproteobacteria bacterium]|nr:sigma-70 family RNA polymerase sigma factor [Gammaproteobacteria bacterium]
MNEPKHISEKELEALHDEAFKWALSCCRFDHEKARDVMQNCYLEILEQRAVFYGESSLRTWLFSVIRHLALRQSKKQYSFEGLKTKLSLFENTDSEGSDIVGQVNGKQVKDLVLKSIDALPLKQRQIVELVYYRGFTIAEAATVIGVGLGSARTHLHRAKKTLERELLSIRIHK